MGAPLGFAAASFVPPIAPGEPHIRQAVGTATTFADVRIPPTDIAGYDNERSEMGAKLAFE